MSKKAVHPECSPIPAGPYTPALIAGDFVFVSGQTPEKPGTDEMVQGDIKVQTRQVMENIQNILAAAGCTMNNVVKVHACLVNMRDFAGYNEVYKQFFSKPYPTRTTVECGVAGGCLVEIDVIALRPAEK
ncbi:RidA family protein [Geosporobacter ferrireducens]|uniref:Reactive intermediate/imine deaminase n=1 Tax=Geosporobacter ferrireducens TaxID=1424294 RepID=A0A1D8GCS8_9FIRM|nr:Rid family detoxifying hydrolase [Geosporobacter ferrireducens]AOT68709.1 hypothetical protein Gferi_03425 [Geosporobacter ferrireducens]